MRECFFGSYGVAPTHGNVLGVLSLIVYALLLVISIKYIAIVMRADNQGEGGILALTALMAGGPAGSRAVLVLLGIFGAALLYGDGMITPAVTVLGAVEGLKVAVSIPQRYLVPLAVTILVAVFSIQRHGSHRLGRLFGPVMVAWFAVLAVLGTVWIARYPDVIVAVDPRHAVRFLIENRFQGFAVLGAVFLVVTGGEALYADMGHFGARPIRIAWFAVVLPALLLNYFGQGAMLLHQPGVKDPFFELAPKWAQRSSRRRH
jgi:KUP system potassium uptake protein